MRLENSFIVPLPPEEAWEVLLDLERIAPCMPGATLEGVEDGEYHGKVKVKLGAITAEFKGTAAFEETDPEARRAVLVAQGRDARGQGRASATVTAQLRPDDDGTEITVETDLVVSGRIAQFGRGVLGDVSANLMGQFAECLQSELAAPVIPAPQPVPDGAAAEPAVAARPTSDAVDLLAVAGGPIAKRAAVVVALAAAVALIVVVVRSLQG